MLSQAQRQQSKEKLITYSPSSLQLWSPRELTFLKHSVIFIKMTLWTTYSLVMALLFVYVQGGPGSATLAVPLWANADAEFQTISAFVLGGFVGYSLTAWCSRRSQYQCLCNTVRGLIVQLATILPHEPDVAARRKRLGRWVTLALDLAVLKARGAMDAVDSREALLSRGALEADEWEQMVSGDRHTTVAFWIQLEIRALHSEGRISSLDREMTAPLVEDLRTLCNDLMSSISRDIPFPYAHALATMVEIVLFIKGTWTALLCATPNNTLYADDGESDPRLLPLMWISQLGCYFLVGVLYYTLREAHVLLHNPFGARRLDVPHTTVRHQLEELAASLLNGRHMPAPIRQDEPNAAAACKSPRKSVTMAAHL